MGFDPDIHHRQSIRLRGYDYSQPGAYFITICVHQRWPLFGDIVDGVMMLNAAGKMAEQWWWELSNKFSGIRLGEYVTMPNHIHGVVHIVGADLCVCPKCVCPKCVCPKCVCPKCVCPKCVCPVCGGNAHQGAHAGAPLRMSLRVCPVCGGNAHQGAHTGAPLHKMVQWYKTMTTNAYIRGVNGEGWSTFNGRLWQRNYYEHIIRDDHALWYIAEYIRTNPEKWQDDVYHVHTL